MQTGQVTYWGQIIHLWQNSEPWLWLSILKSWCPTPCHVSLSYASVDCQLAFHQWQEPQIETPAKRGQYFYSSWPMGLMGWHQDEVGVRAPCLYPSSPCPFLNALSTEHLQRCSGFVVLNKHIWGRNSTCSQFCKKFHCQHRSKGEKSPLYL